MLKSYLLDLNLSQQTFLVFQDVFSVTLFVFQDLLKTSSRRLENVFAIRLPKTSSRRFQGVFKSLPRRLQDVFKMSSRRVCKTSCNYVFKTSSRRVCKMSCNYVFKTSSRRRGRQKNVTLKTSWRRLEDVFSMSSPRRMFAGIVRQHFEICFVFIYHNLSFKTIFIEIIFLSISSSGNFLYAF